MDSRSITIGIIAKRRWPDITSETRIEYVEKCFLIMPVMHADKRGIPERWAGEIPNRDPEQAMGQCELMLYGYRFGHDHEDMVLMAYYKPTDTLFIRKE